MSDGEIEVRTTAEIVERPTTVPEGWRELSDTVMSNFDHQIDGAVEDALQRGGCYSSHTGWNFCGDVWFEQGEWHEQVFRYHQAQGTYSATTLHELMHDVNDIYGWE